jgi:glycosyltransferase involved in cell wall biosynthesis
VIVDAFLLLARNEPTVQLVLAGGVGWGMSNVLEKIKRSEFKNRIIMTGYVSEEEKAGLYENTQGFLFPSLYEGFGIPILESFSYGVPVITAKNSSLPEVGGDAAIYIEDAMSADELAKSMKLILNASEFDRNTMSKKAIQQFSKFTWKKCSKEIFDLFCASSF